MALMDTLFNPQWVCPHCGEISPTEFMHHLNHYIDPDGMCTTSKLRARHRTVALRKATERGNLPDLSTTKGSIK